MAELSTEQTLFRTAEVLKKTGLLVLDAHRSPLDVVRTANFLRKNFPKAKLLMPMAGYLMHVPIINWLLNYWVKLKRIEAIPVYRRVDDNPITFWMWFFCQFYPKSLTKEIKATRNLEYKERAESFIKTKNSILLASPYGTTLREGGGRIMGGILKLMQISEYYCLSYSKVITFEKPRFSPLFKKEYIADYDEFFISEFNKLVHPELSTKY